MTSRKINKDDLEQQLLGLLKGTIQGMDRKIDNQSTAQSRLEGLVRNSNQRISKLEAEVFPPPIIEKDLPEWYRDPAIIKLLTYVTVALIFILIVLATLKGIKLPGLL